MTHAYSIARVRAVLVFSLFVLIVASLLLPTQAQADTSSLTVGNYQLISSTRINRTVYEYTYKASISNIGENADDVTARLNISVPGITVLDGELSFGDVNAGAATVSADTFTVQHNRVYAFDENVLQWEITVAPKLAPPSDPQIIDLGDAENPLPVNTLVYTGSIQVPLSDGIVPESLAVEIGTNNTALVAADGSFSIRLNEHATGLLRVADSQGNILLLQLFPKAEGLVKVNPKITPLSTAVAMVALQPGVITNNPLTDALVVSILEQLPETAELANEIAREIAEGIFAFNRAYSPEVKEAMGQVMQTLTLLSETVAEANSISDLAELSIGEKLVRYAERITTELISEAHAEPSIGAKCTDSFSTKFSGHPGTADDVCIIPTFPDTNGEQSVDFDIFNQRARWMFFGNTNDASGFGPIAYIPARHVEIPGMSDILKNFFKLGMQAVADTKDLIIGTAKGIYRLSFKGVYKDKSGVNQMLSEAANNLLYGTHITTKHTFQENGEFLLATIGSSEKPLSVLKEQEKYKSYSLASTYMSELALPLASALLDIPDRDDQNTNFQGCFEESASFLIDVGRDISGLIQQAALSSNSQFLTSMGQYLASDMLPDVRTWQFAGCIIGIKRLYDAGGVADLLVSALGVNLYDKVAAPFAEVGWNTLAFYRALNDENLPAEDFYRIQIGNRASSGSFAVNSRVELSPSASQITVFESAGGNVKGYQQPGIKGTVLAEKALVDGSKWWSIDFDEGIDGWVTGNILQQIENGNTGNTGDDGNTGDTGNTDGPSTGNSSFIWPVTSPDVTGRYAGGYVESKYHTALDIVSTDNDLYVHAAADGIARVYSMHEKNTHDLGNVVIIDHNNGNGPFTLYGHLFNFKHEKGTDVYTAEYEENGKSYKATVKDGAFVKAGEIIGVMGNTGYVIRNECQKDSATNKPYDCGRHLHFEVKQRGVLGNLADDSSYWGYTADNPNLYGFINPNPYLDHGWQKYSPRVVSATENQEIHTGPKDGYNLSLGQVVAGQKFVATQQVDDWYEIDFPSEYGPAKGWIKAKSVSGISIWKVTTDQLNVCSTAAACNETESHLSYVWNPQYIVGTWKAPSQDLGKCKNLWIKTSLINGKEGWVCGEFLEEQQINVAGSNQNQCGVDYNASRNKYDAFRSSAPNFGAFVALKADGSITAWGNWSHGGSGAPTDDGYVSIVSTGYAFAALKADGSITAWGTAWGADWGNPDYGGSGAPTDNDYVSIASNDTAFAALKADGSITAWGEPDDGGSGAPTGNDYVSIASTSVAFAALRTNGSITAWGGTDWGGVGAPTDNGYVSIASNVFAFAALKADGSITAWGGATWGGSGAPTDNGYVSIASTDTDFAALKADGSITTWNGTDWGGVGAPTDNGYVSIASTDSTFAALKADGSITVWGNTDKRDAPTDNGYVSIVSNDIAFAALKANGSVTAWGSQSFGGSGAPTDNGYVSIASTDLAFAALKADGSITAWGSPYSGGSGAPTDNGYVSIASTDSTFAALKADGSITVWGSPYRGGNGVPTDNGYISINGVGPQTPSDCTYRLNLENPVMQSMLP